MDVTGCSCAHWFGPAAPSTLSLTLFTPQQRQLPVFSTRARPWLQLRLFLLQGLWLAQKEKRSAPGLTSFRRSLLSLCRCHLMRACGERAWHSRKVLLPSTPYCTISRVFLLAAGQTDRHADRSRQTTQADQKQSSPSTLCGQNLSFGKSSSRIPITSEMPEHSDYGRHNNGGEC